MALNNNDSNNITDTIRYFEVKINGYGGEYVAGLISDPNKIEALRELSQQGRLEDCNSEATEEYGIQLSCNENDNILHSHGVDLERSEYFSIKVRELKSPEAYNYLTSDEVWSNNCMFSDNDNPLYVNANNPYIEGRDEYDDSLVLLCIKHEEKMSVSYLIETENDFKADYLLAGTTLMDELFGVDDNIIDKLYYFEKEKFIDWIEKKINYDTDDGKAVKEAYKNQKSDLLDHYEDNLEPFVSTVYRHLKDIKGLSSDKQHYLGVFSDFECKVIVEQDGLIAGTVTKLTTTDGEEYSEQERIGEAFDYISQNFLGHLTPGEKYAEMFIMNNFKDADNLLETIRNFSTTETEDEIEEGIASVEYWHDELKKFRKTSEVKKIDLEKLFNEANLGELANTYGPNDIFKKIDVSVSKENIEIAKKIGEMLYEADYYYNEMRYFLESIVEK